MSQDKVFFNLFKDSKKEGEYFVSHPSNGAKGIAKKNVSKNGNDILVFDLQVEGLHLKGVFNRTNPATAKAGSPQIWGEVEDGGKIYRLAGWYTTTKKNGEAVKTPYFSCSVQEKVNQDADAPVTQPQPAMADIEIPF
jgi:hypothetical protein